MLFLIAIFSVVELEKPRYLINNLAARKYGKPLYPSPVAQSTYPPNIGMYINMLILIYYNYFLWIMFLNFVAN